MLIFPKQWKIKQYNTNIKKLGLVTFFVLKKLHYKYDILDDIPRLPATQLIRPQFMSTHEKLLSGVHMGYLNNPSSGEILLDQI